MAPIERFNYVLKQRRTKSLAALEKVMKEEPSGSTMSLNSVGQQMGLSSPILQNERNLHATKRTKTDRIHAPWKGDSLVGREQPRDRKTGVLRQ